MADDDWDANFGDFENDDGLQAGDDNWDDFGTETTPSAQTSTVKPAAPKSEIQNEGKKASKSEAATQQNASNVEGNFEDWGEDDGGFDEQPQSVPKESKIAQEKKSGNPKVVQAEDDFDKWDEDDRGFEDESPPTKSTSTEQKASNGLNTKVTEPEDDFEGGWDETFEPEVDSSKDIKAASIDGKSKVPENDVEEPKQSNVEPNTLSEQTPQVQQELAEDVDAKNVPEDEPPVPASTSDPELSKQNQVANIPNSEPTVPEETKTISKSEQVSTSQEDWDNFAEFNEPTSEPIPESSAAGENDTWGSFGEEAGGVQPEAEAEAKAEAKAEPVIQSEDAIQDPKEVPNVEPAPKVEASEIKNDILEESVPVREQEMTVGRPDTSESHVESAISGISESADVQKRNEAKDEELEIEDKKEEMEHKNEEPPEEQTSEFTEKDIAVPEAKSPVDLSEPKLSEVDQTGQSEPEMQPTETIPTPMEEMLPVVDQEDESQPESQPQPTAVVSTQQEEKKADELLTETRKGMNEAKASLEIKTSLESKISTETQTKIDSKTPTELPKEDPLSPPLMNHDDPFADLFGEVVQSAPVPNDVTSNLSKTVSQVSDAKEEETEETFAQDASASKDPLDISNTVNKSDQQVESEAEEPTEAKTVGVEKLETKVEGLKTKDSNQKENGGVETVPSQESSKAQETSVEDLVADIAPVTEVKASIPASEDLGQEKESKVSIVESLSSPVQKTLDIGKGIEANAEDDIVGGFDTEFKNNLNPKTREGTGDGNVTVRTDPQLDDGDKIDAKSEKVTSPTESKHTAKVGESKTPASVENELESKGIQPLPENLVSQEKDKEEQWDDGFSEHEPSAQADSPEEQSNNSHNMENETKQKENKKSEENFTPQVGGQWDDGFSDHEPSARVDDPEEQPEKSKNVENETKEKEDKKSEEKLTPEVRETEEQWSDGFEEDSPKNPSSPNAESSNLKVAHALTSGVPSSTLADTKNPTTIESKFDTNENWGDFGGDDNAAKVEAKGQTAGVANPDLINDQDDDGWGNFGDDDVDEPVAEKVETQANLSNELSEQKNSETTQKEPEKESKASIAVEDEEGWGNFGDSEEAPKVKANEEPPITATSSPTGSGVNQKSVDTLPQTSNDPPEEEWGDFGDENETEQPKNVEISKTTTSTVTENKTPVERPKKEDTEEKWGDFGEEGFGGEEEKWDDNEEKWGEDFSADVNEAGGGGKGMVANAISAGSAGSSSEAVKIWTLPKSKQLEALLSYTKKHFGIEPETESREKCSADMLTEAVENVGATRLVSTMLQLEGANPWDPKKLKWHESTAQKYVHSLLNIPIPEKRSSLKESFKLPPISRSRTGDSSSSRNINEKNLLGIDVVESSPTEPIEQKSGSAFGVSSFGESGPVGGNTSFEAIKDEVKKILLGLPDLGFMLNVSTKAEVETEA